MLATGFATDFFAVEGGEEYTAPAPPKTVKPEKVEKTDSSWRREAVLAREGPIVAAASSPSSTKKSRSKLEEDTSFEVIDRRAIADNTLDIDDDEEEKLRNRRRRIQTSQSEKSGKSGKTGGIRGFFRRLFGG